MNTHNRCFEQKYEKYQNFSSENFHVLVVKFSVYLNRYVFVMPSGLFYLNSLDKSISYIRGAWLVFIIVREISELNANSVDPDQTPHSAASDLGLHGLPMSLLWDARLEWFHIYFSLEIPKKVLQHLIWVCTVSQLPFWGSPD